MSEWINTRIKEIVKINPESFSSARNYSYINYLDTGNITKGVIDNYQKLVIGTNKLPSRAKRIVKKGDIIFSTVRPNQEHYGYIACPIDNIVVSTGFAVLRAKQLKCNGKFLYYCLTLPDITNYLSNVAEDSTTAYPSIKPDVILDLELSLPSLLEQGIVAEVLSSFDDKIDLLNKQNATLEELAKTYFRQWFIYNPRSANTIKVSEIAFLANKLINPSHKPKDTFHHFSIPAFDNALKPIIEIGSSILSSKFEVLPNSVLISKLNPIKPRIWLIDNKVLPNSICSTEFQVLKTFETKYFYFLYFLMKLNEITSEFALGSTGTSGSHQRIQPKQILDLKIPMPDSIIIDDFNDLCDPIMTHVCNNRQQIISLQKIRDTLLPKLISGEIRIRQ